MRNIVILIFVLCVLPVFGQNLDSSAVIKLETLWDLYVTPQGELMFFDDAHVYSQEFEDKYWRQEDFIYQNGEKNKRISLEFINSDIWLAHKTNRLDGTENEKPLIIQRTTDRGVTWEKTIVGYTKEQYWGGFNELFQLGNGKIWLVGSERTIYYSEDLGATWTTKHLTDYVDEVAMQNDSTGVAIMFNNYIIITRDNFETSIKIPTPHDQKLAKNQGINHVFLYNNHLIVRQSSEHFSTMYGDTIWQPFFDNQFSSLKLDRETNCLFGRSKKGDFVKFDDDLKSFDEHIAVRDSVLRLSHFNWQIIDDTVYAQTNFDDFYRITPHSFECKKNHLFTYDIEIKPPRYIHEFGDTKFGYNHYFDGIYMLKSDKWYRVAENYFYEGLDRHSWGFRTSYRPYPKTVGDFIVLFFESRFQKLEGVASNLLYFDTKNYAYYEPEILKQTYIMEIDTFEDRLFAYGYDTTSTGKLLYSDDTLNWNLLYNWENELLSDIFIRSKDSIYIKSKQGSVQFLTWTDENLTVDTLITYDENSKEITYPANFYPNEFYFKDDKTGFVKGYGMSSHSKREYVTEDGGKSWKPIRLPFVRNVQKALKERGYAVEVTEILDEKTKNAVLEFQKKHKLPQGNLDYDTLKKLGVTF